MYVTSADGAETTLYCQREGQWNGDGSLLKAEPRRHDLRALKAAHIVLVPAETFQALRRASIEFNQFLCDTMNERLGEFVTMLAAPHLAAGSRAATRKSQSRAVIKPPAMAWPFKAASVGRG